MTFKQNIFVKFLVLFLILYSEFIQIYSKKINSIECDISDENQRFDCFPEKGANEKDCLNRGCCWNPNQKNIDIENNNNNNNSISKPYCYFPNNFPSYSIINNDKKIVDTNGASYFLNKKTATFRQNEILNLTVDLYYDTEQRVRIQIYDSNKIRYEVPLDVNKNKNKFKKLPKSEYYVNIIDEPFGIKVFRKSTNTLIFDTSIAPLIFADQFIQFSTILPNSYIYGIGENQDSLQRITDWRKYTLWTRDYAPETGVNLYGAHPFYMSMDNNGNSMGFFLLNSNAMDVILQPYPAVTFITIGGILDFFIYMGPTPSDVIRQHMLTIGLPFMPPYFSLGFHLCRWGYHNQNKLVEVIKRNRAANIPYDVQWSDIDAMDGQKDWTYSKVNFRNLPEIVVDLHNHDQYYINIIDPAISNRKGYPPYDEGVVKDVFMKYYNSKEPLIGSVWPGNTVYPDFTKPNTTDWWIDQAVKFHKIISFDGIWIDMNEPSNFVNGSIVGCTNTSLDNPPYVPNVVEGQLQAKTICPSAQQYLSTHYNLHNMYGYFESISTFEALKTVNITRRPFVLSRSTFSGSGHYTAHWTGDNKATWDDLYYSIPSILNFNMFGIPMVGADICGFNLNTTEELCIRWMQLGSFYPFMRNHNGIDNIDQDPGVFSKNAQDIMRNSLFLRYQLLPYIYTLFYRSHLFGETVARPLFFEFPFDLNTRSIDKQFLFGPALLISPVLTQNTSTLNAYFPNTTWYDIYTGEKINGSSNYISLDAPLSKINVHVRSGSIIPMQHPEVTTVKSRKNPFILLVALNTNSSIPSFGTLFWDDGETIDTIENNAYNLFYFFAKEASLQIELDSNYNGYKTSMILDTIVIYGVQQEPKYVIINNEKYFNFKYDSMLKVLKIQYLHIDIYNSKLVYIQWF